MGTFLLNVSPNRNFGDVISVQDFSGIHVLNFVRCSPQPKESGATPDSHPVITISHEEVIDILHLVLLVD